MIKTVKARVSPLFICFPSKNSSLVSPREWFIWSTNIQALSVNRTGYVFNVKSREIGHPGFKQPLSQDSPEFLTSNISPCLPLYINIKVGTSSSKRNYTICPTVKIQWKTHINSRWYSITMFPVPWSFSLLFPLPSKRGAVLPQHFPSYLYHYPLLPPSRILPLTFA